MRSIINYFRSFYHGVTSLLTGMRITLGEFFTRKTTEQYPENRATLQMYNRFRGELTMLHDAQNQYKCVACGICEMNCPNGTIHIESEMEEAEGKKRKRLIAYHYDIGSCIFCQLCVKNCPYGAIAFDTKFEHAVFTRDKLVRTLNHEGSTLEKK